jgi:two-component system sensor histidine kinase UhpB
MCLEDLERPESRKAGIPMFPELASGKHDSYRQEIPFASKDGRTIWGHLLVSLVRDANGQPQFAIAMLEDISERKLLEAELAELNHRMSQGREDDRLHLSRELHDGPVQELYGLSYHLKAFADSLPPEIDRLPVGKMQASMQQVINTLRTLCGELRPPTLTPFGLEKAIRSHATNFQESYPGMAIQLNMVSDGQEIPEPVRLALFRIYQQAMTNVVRHANARHVLVHLDLDQENITLAIQDDGDGFLLPTRWIEFARNGHLGLLGAVERAQSVGGQLKIESAPGKGTLLRASVPYIGDFSGGDR